MPHRSPVFLLLAVSLLAACAEKPESGTETAEPVLTAQTLGAQAVTSARNYLEDARYAMADKRNGARQAQICRACHSLEQGGANQVGPGLYGMFGKPAGRVDGFNYSEALESATFVWTPRALDAWLAQPARFLPGNRMAFAGVMNEDDRNDLIAYLLDVTGDSADE